jgi:hypothetical protein
MLKLEDKWNEDLNPLNIHQNKIETSQMFLMKTLKNWSNHLSFWKSLKILSYEFFFCHDFSLELKSKAKELRMGGLNME